MRIKTRIILTFIVVVTLGTIIYIYPKSEKTQPVKENTNTNNNGKFMLDNEINAKLNGGIIMPDMFNVTEKYANFLI